MSKAVATAGVVLSLLLGMASVPAFAGVLVSVTPNYPVKAGGVPWNVGDSFTGTVVLTNFSTAPNNTNLIDVDAVRFTPSCGSTSGGGVCDTVPISFADPGVFSVTNPVGSLKCAGSAFTVANVNGVTGEFDLVAVPPVQLGSSDLLQGQIQCAITFTVTVLKIPTIDAFDPAPAGIQTLGLARGDFTDNSTDEQASGDGGTAATIVGPGLTMVKTATPPTVTAGQNAVFTITIDNTTGTGAATNVELSDTLTNFGSTWTLSMNPAVPGCSLSVANPQVLTCDTLTVPAGQVQVLTLTAPTSALACPPALVNIASLNGANGFDVRSARSPVKPPLPASR